MLEKYSKEKRASILEEILVHYFNRNFGSMSKTDLELLLFNIVLEYKREYEPNLCSDYSLSNVMGISQSRIRNMKQKAELVYPRKGFDKKWKDYFIDDIRYAKYDEKSGLVKMNIPDIAVLNELRNYMEENNWYNEYQLNPKLFQCPLDVFILLCEKITANEIIIDNETKKRLAILKNDLVDVDSKDVVQLFLEGNTNQAIKKIGNKLPKIALKAILNAVPFSMPIKILCEALAEK